MRTTLRIAAAALLLLASTSGACADWAGLFEALLKEAEAMDSVGAAGDRYGSIEEVRGSAEQGEADAQVLLGMYYWFGQGVPKDYREAESWLRKAAMQGYAPGQALLGLWLAGRAERGILGGYTLEGRGDVVEAYAWFNLLAIEGEAAGEVRDATEELMTSAQVAEGQALTRELEARIRAR